MVTLAPIASGSVASRGPGARRSAGGLSSRLPMEPLDAADRRLRPAAPLPGPPDPWASTGTPSPRSGPPYHMTDMIAAEPALAGDCSSGSSGRGPGRRPGGGRSGRRLDAGEPVVMTGCGTSEHAAQAAAEILARGGRRGGLRDGEHRPASRPSSCRSAAGGRARDRRLARGRDGRHERGAGGGPRRRRANRGAHGQPSLAGAARWPTSWSRPTSSTRAGVTSSATSARSWPPRPSAAHLTGRPVDAAAVGRSARRRRARRDRRRADRGRARRRAPAHRRRIGRRSTGRPRARAQGRGGILAAVRLPRPRDVPARPPAGDRTRPRGSS